MIPMIHIKIFGADVKLQVHQIVYVILAALGVYLIFSAVRMKKKAEISSFLIPQETLAACRDPKGFAAELWKSVLLLGMVSMAFGIYGITDIFLPIFGWGYDLIGSAVFFLSVGWFVKEQKRCIEKFCN